MITQTIRIARFPSKHFHCQPDMRVVGQRSAFARPTVLLELSKCRIEVVETEQDRWLKFFVEGERLDDEHLPVWMQTEEMRQAMSTLKAFSEKERACHEYQARQNYLRQQKSMEAYEEALRAEAERARAAEAQERAEKEAALAEIERLKTLLRN